MTNLNDTTDNDVTLSQYAYQINSTTSILGLTWTKFEVPNTTDSTIDIRRNVHSVLQGVFNQYLGPEITRVTDIITPQTT